MIHDQTLPSRSLLDLILIKEVIKNKTQAKATITADNKANIFPLLSSAGDVVVVVSCGDLVGRVCVP